METVILVAKIVSLFFIMMSTPRVLYAILHGDSDNKSLTLILAVWSVALTSFITLQFLI